MAKFETIITKPDSVNLTARESRDNFLKRDQGQRRQDVLTLSQIIIASADQHPNDKNNPVNRWKKDWRGRAKPKSRNPADYPFFRNRQLNIIKTTETTNIEHYGVEQLTNLIWKQDIDAATANAVGIVALKEAVAIDDLELAAAVLTTRPDLHNLIELVQPVVDRLLEPRGNFGYQIAKLKENSRFGGADLLLFEDKGTELTRLGEVASQYLRHKETIGKDSIRKYGEGKNHAAVEKQVRLILSDDSHLNLGQGFSKIWEPKVDLARPNAMVLPDILSIIDQSWFQEAQVDTKDRLTDLIAGMAIAENEKQPDSPSDRNKLVSILHDHPAQKWICPTAVR